MEMFFSAIQRILKSGQILFIIFLATNIIEIFLRFLQKRKCKEIKVSSFMMIVAKKILRWGLIIFSFSICIVAESIGLNFNVDISFVYFLGWAVTSVLLFEEYTSILRDMVGLRILRIPDHIVGEQKINGRLIINTSDPYKDTWRFDFDGSIEDLPKQDIVAFKVIHEKPKNDSADSKKQ